MRKRGHWSRNENEWAKLEDVRTDGALGRKPYDSIRVADQTWLGPERFDMVCVARAEGMKERQFMKEVFAFSTSDLRG